MTATLRETNEIRILRLALPCCALLARVSCVRRPTLHADSMSCTTDDNCLPGYTCVAGLCRKPDAGVTARWFLDSDMYARQGKGGFRDFMGLADRQVAEGPDGTRQDLPGSRHRLCITDLALRIGQDVAPRRVDGRGLPSPEQPGGCPPPVFALRAENMRR
jgi:hypothetical protein